MGFPSDPFSSSSSPSSSQNQGVVTQEEFFAFHNIDRQLFSRLVFHLRREPSEAVQVVALWLWLERINRALFINTILTYPDPIVEVIFDETLLALRAAETENFYLPNDPYDIPMLQSIVGRDGFSLRHFHENRIALLLGVGHIVQQVCLRAFEDLIKMIFAHTQVVPPCNSSVDVNHEAGGQPITGASPAVSGIGVSPCVNVAGSGFGNPRAPQPQQPSPPPLPQANILNQNFGQGVMTHHSSFRVGDFNVPLHDPSQIPSSSGGSSYDAHASDNTQIQGNEGALVEMLARMRLNENHRFHERPLPSTERTIFLTFSKGYPISEPELREFLDRSFGDIIETLYMQEVRGIEQPLFARLVVRDARAMEVVLNGQTKSKFSINGKHVWARKYVRQKPNSPPSSPSDETG